MDRGSEGTSGGADGKSLTLAVVIPVHNEAARLPALLGELRSGDERPDELVVSDGESVDGSAELAERAGARVLRGEKGRGAQLRRGAATVRSDVMLFLHADARLEPGSLTALRRAFREPELVAAGLPQRIEHERGIYRVIERAADRRVRRGWIYGDSALAVRRVDYEAVGGFRPLPIFEDLDLSRRLRGRGRVRLVTEGRVVISPRRWEEDGPVRRTLMNRALTLAFRLGIDPERLARFYPPPGARRRPAPVPGLSTELQKTVGGGS